MAKYNTFIIKLTNRQGSIMDIWYHCQLYRATLRSFLSFYSIWQIVLYILINLSRNTYGYGMKNCISSNILNEYKLKNWYVTDLFNSIPDKYSAKTNRNIYENQMLNFSSTLKACHKYSEYLIRSASVLNKPTLYQLFCNFNIQINEMEIWN